MQSSIEALGLIILVILFIVGLAAWIAIDLGNIMDAFYYEAKGIERRKHEREASVVRDALQHEHEDELNINSNSD